MKIAFRCDASMQLGSGHVMRCLVLARALAVQGAVCTFLCSDLAGHLGAYIREQGFDRVLMNLPDVHEDARQSHDALAAMGGVDWLVVDHYALDAAWESGMRHVCQRIMVIDDLADRQHDADLLLDQNLGREAHDYAGLLSAAAICLTGSHYALLRPEFAVLREQQDSRSVPPATLRLLLSLGGSDPDNVTGKIIALLAGAWPADRPLELDVVAGLQYPWLEALRIQTATLPFMVRLHQATPHMAELMMHSDMAIGAAGGTAWERCCLGLPSLLVVLADNQRMGAANLQRAGAALLLGEPWQLEQSLLPALFRLAEPTRLQAYRQAAWAVTDGGGAERVVDRILALT